VSVWEGNVANSGRESCEDQSRGFIGGAGDLHEFRGGYAAAPAQERQRDKPLIWTEVRAVEGGSGGDGELPTTGEAFPHARPNRLPRTRFAVKA
jgi:hypothetical protein